MALKKKEIIKGKYPPYSFRLHPETVEKLEGLMKKKEIKSWNLLFLELVKKYENL